MQSFLQYRRVGKLVQSHVGNDLEKTITATPSPPASPLQQQGNPRSYYPEMTTAITHNALNHDFGVSLDGIDIRDRTTREGKGSLVFVVRWAGEGDSTNPHNWSFAKRSRCTLLVAMVCFVCMVSSSIDSAVAPQAAAAFGVSPVVESIATGKARSCYSLRD